MTIDRAQPVTTQTVHIATDNRIEFVDSDLQTPPLPSILYPPFFIFFPIENDIPSIFLKVKFFDTINIFRVMIF